jgi:membrane protease YdiL (CAAX protease family)
MLWLGNLSEWLGVIAVVMIAGISPMMKRVRRVDFTFPRRELTYASSLFALIYVFAFQYFKNPFFSFFKDFSAGFWGGEVAQRALLALICLVPFIIALIARGQPILSIGWHPSNLRAALSVGMLLAVLVIFLRGKFMTMIGGISREQAAALGIYLVLVVAEETIFRGYIQPRLQAQFGQRWGWLVTAILFMLWQLPGRIWITPFTSLWIILVTGLIQGLLLGWIMQKSGHVLAPILYRAVSLWISVF